MTGFTK